MEILREFVRFDKLSRLKRECVITEKIDGRNSAVCISPDGDVWAQSRSKIITLADDNAGFARWVDSNKEALTKELGPGVHFGEWWGRGVERPYNLAEKRFSLFNVGRWHGSPSDDWRCIEAPTCFVVPTLKICEFNTALIDEALADLGRTGSQASPGYMNPEGIVVFHTQNQALYKVTFEYDVLGKGKNRGGE